MTDMYEILAQCLSEIEQGMDVDTVLFHHPEYADELRPILEASISARDMAVPAPSREVVLRNRAKLLQYAAQMREARAKPVSRFWSASLRRAIVAFVVIIALFVSGTELVRASSTTIPGDNLYPVKRTWEDVLLLFTFDPQQREELEFEHENERLEEVNELFAEGRSVNVDFAGYVTRLTTTGYRVSGISVVISPETDLPTEPVPVGMAVRIVGVTKNDGTVLAERVELLPVGMKLPDMEDHEQPEIEQENSNGSDKTDENESNSGSDVEAPRVEGTQTPKVESTSEKESFEGVLDAIDERNKVWSISGQWMDVSSAEIKGSPRIGARVNGEGYKGKNGVFIVTKIEIENSSDVGSDSNDNNDNDDDDNSNNDNSNNDNSNDDS